VLLQAIRRAIERSREALGQVAKLERLRERYASLTRREGEVMTLVVAGLPNKEVAAELGRSEITIKGHRGKVMQKMEAGSLADLVRRPRDSASHLRRRADPLPTGRSPPALLSAPLDSRVRWIVALTPYLGIDRHHRLIDSPPRLCRNFNRQTELVQKGRATGARAELKTTWEVEEHGAHTAGGCMGDAWWPA